MNNMLGFALLVGGVILIIFGFNAAHSAGSDISRVFTGNPSDRSMWMILGGAVAAVIGLVSVLRGRARP
ncbi:MAG: rane protein [Verrucomicrobiales bacterium]|nr:rane protein [Verrucomicrobiales bacterium]